MVIPKNSNSKILLKNYLAEILAENSFRVGVLKLVLIKRQYLAVVSLFFDYYGESL